ncbi:MAG: DUF1565 domain-containing protein, partial [Bacteroidales bacterium]|nr:DUF1565 domain-containing protein [Bacteroidales bacterium]
MLVVAIMSATSAAAYAQPYYVAATGSDSNSGTLTAPFKTITKAVSVVKAGETIYVRGGTYNLTAT